MRTAEGAPSGREVRAREPLAPWRLESLAARAPGPERRRAFRWVLGAAFPASLLVVAAVVAFLSVSLEPQARLVFFTFAAATVLWCTTRFNAAFVGLSAVVFLIVTGGAPQSALFEALASDVVWLMIGAFIVAAALRSTGLSDRLSYLLLRRARTAGGAFWLLTTALIPLSCFVPSTSGRAAMFLPVFHSAAAALDDRRTVRALSLLIPAVVLTSTSSTLIAAGSHLIANDLLGARGGEAFTYARWALYGVPFGIATSYVACAGVLRILLDPGRRARPFRLPETRYRRDMTAREGLTLVVSAGMVVLWLTQPVHGLGVATVTVAGALALCLPRVGCIAWKDGLRAVSWNLVLFVGAAIVLGRLLLDSGVAAWLTSGLLAASQLEAAGSELLLVVALSLVTLTSHLYMPSHSARVAVLVPPLLVLVEKLGVQASSLIFIATMGINYCLTLPIHSKALLLYQELSSDAFEAGDLLRLGAALLPIHLVLIVVFYFGYWRWAGLAL